MMLKISSLIQYERTDVLIKGEVVPNVKLPEDICVLWETGQLISYDEEVLLDPEGPYRVIDLEVK